MNDLTAITANLPTTIEDLSKFVLVGREKLTSVRAEIRAIEKLELAEGVRNQKRDEARMLSEALLDAEVRLGELFKLIPKATPNNNPFHEKPTGGQFVKSKADVASQLGFDRHQVQRFETLADHPDLVEQVKADARENDDLPTRTAVLNLAKYKKEREEAEYRQIDEDARLAMLLNKVMEATMQLPVDAKSMEAMARGAGLEVLKHEMLDIIKSAIRKLMIIENYFERGI